MERAVEVLLGVSAGVAVGVAVGVVITGIRLWLTVRHHQLSTIPKRRS